MATPEPTLRNLPAFQLAGIRRWHSLVDAPKTIPNQWHDLHASGLPGLAEAKITYGATAQMDVANQRLEYFAGYEVVDFEGIPAYGRVSLAAAQYAVFTLNTVSEIRPFWQQILAEWLSASGYKMGDSPDFERYDERFDAVSRGPLEVWVPIRNE